MSIQPEGKDLRDAVRWVSEERKLDPARSSKRLADEASLKFNLSPKDAEFLSRFVTEGE